MNHQSLVFQSVIFSVLMGILYPLASYFLLGKVIPVWIGVISGAIGGLVYYWGLKSFYNVP